MLEELYPIFLDTGRTPKEFYYFSLGEVVDVIQSHRRQQEESLKTEALLNNVLARQIVELLIANIAIGMGTNEEKVNITSLHEFFPTLFSTTENKEKINKNLELHKERMRDYAFWHNQKRKVVMGKNGGNDT